MTSDDAYYMTLDGTLVVGAPTSGGVEGNYTVTVRSANGSPHSHTFDVRTSDINGGGSEPAIDEFRILAPPVDALHVLGRQRPFRVAAGRAAAVSPASAVVGDDGDPRVDGASAVFECAPAASGRAPPLVRWLIDGMALVPETSGVHTEQRGRRLVLSDVARWFNIADGDDEEDDDDRGVDSTRRDPRTAIVTCEAIAGPLKATASARLRVIGKC